MSGTQCNNSKSVFLFVKRFEGGADAKLTQTLPQKHWNLCKPPVGRVETGFAECF